MMGMRHSFDYVRKAIQKENYELLESSYINSLQKLEILCDKGHVFPMSFKVFQRGHRCSYCAGKRQYDHKEVSDFFSSHGYTLISETYETNRSKLKVLGPDGNEYETTFFAFKVSGVIPHLKHKPKAQEVVRSLFEELLGHPFLQARPDWLINPKTGRKLELDGYCEVLKLAFEYDGEHHFQNVEYSNEVVETIFERDLAKRKLCKENGVRLIKVPFYVENKRSFIERSLDNKTLYVGDPHITHNKLEECNNLFEFILKTGIEQKCGRITLMGDLFHTHGVIRVEVLDFWMNWLARLSKNFQVQVLIGNHDKILGESQFAGLSPLHVFIDEYKYTLNIIENPAVIDNIGYLSYYDSEEAFVAAAQELYSQGATKTLVAHQNFTVPLYSDLINPGLVPQEAIITGHIHEQKQSGKVFQVGTPKWDSLTDANEDKGVWVYDQNEDGSTKAKTFFSTADVVTPITKVTMTEGDEDIVLNPKANNYLELIGQTAWINQTKKKYKGLAHITGRPSDRKNININRDRASSMLDFLKVQFKPIDGVKSEDIREYLKEVLNV